MSATTEIMKLLTRKSEYTFSVIMKLIDEDFFPKENAEWARNITENMKEYLLVSFNIEITKLKLSTKMYFYF